MYFLLNLSGRPLILDFLLLLELKTGTLVALGSLHFHLLSKHLLLSLGWPKNAAFFSTLIARNWKLIEQPCSYFFAFYIFFLYSTSFFWQDFIYFSSILTVFPLQKDFGTFISISTLSVFLFFRNILIPFTLVCMNW